MNMEEFFAKVKTVVEECVPSPEGWSVIIGVNERTFAQLAKANPRDTQGDSITLKHGNGEIEIMKEEEPDF